MGSTDCASKSRGTPGTTRLALEEPINEHGGTIRVELNHTSTEPLPEALRSDQRPPDPHRCAQPGPRRTRRHPRHQGSAARLKAGGRLDTAEYRDTEVADGMDRLHRSRGRERIVDEFYDEGVVDLYEARDLPVNTGITLVAGSQSGLGLREDKQIHRIPDRPCSTSGPALEQHIALDLLTDDSVGIVSLGGRAGTGKSVLALAAAPRPSSRTAPTRR